MFESERVRLTAFTDDDLPQFAAWLSDFGLQRLVNPGISMPHDVNHFLDPEGWFQSDLRNDNSRSFAIRTKSDNEFIGSSALINLNAFTHCAEIGINLTHPDYRGKGYGGEVMLLTMRFGFEQFNLNKINLNVMGFNTPAIRLYEKLGFQHEARLRDYLFHDGKMFDSLRMGILRSEWEAKHG